MTQEIEALIRDLSAVESRPDLFNPYDAEAAANETRRANLRRYWQEMAARHPRAALIGEAIGYQGGRMTGIPFVSERILSDPPDGWPLKELNLRPVIEFGRTWAEPTATMVWETMKDLPTLPLFWNGLPFHPHRPEEPLSNRAPRVAELQLGAPFLKQVLALFDIEVAVAVGKKAERALSDLGVDYERVRHPSHGGKVEFQKGIMGLAARGYFDRRE